MKAYTYRADEIGFVSWPSGELRLEGIENTENPSEADLFICPGALMMSQDKNWFDRFPHMNGNEQRHVFFDCSDHDTIYNRRDCILIRCNLKQWMLDAHPNSISWPWPVEDYQECISMPTAGFKYDISFRGWLSTETRTNSSNACRSHSKLISDIEQYSDFTGYLHDRATNRWNDEGIRRRAEFRRSMKESRISLCPESIPGVFPYRFFEALSAGRVPLLVGSDYVLPMQDKIPYSEFIITCPRSESLSAAVIAYEFLLTHDDPTIIEMGRKARHYWEMYLDSRYWPRTMANAVIQKVKEMGLVPIGHS